jgi:hypothetical protein
MHNDACRKGQFHLLHLLGTLLFRTNTLVTGWTAHGPALPVLSAVQFLAIPTQVDESMYASRHCQRTTAVVVVVYVAIPTLHSADASANQAARGNICYDTIVLFVVGRLLLLLLPQYPGVGEGAVGGR